MVYRRPYLISGSSGFALNAITRTMKKDLKVNIYLYPKIYRNSKHCLKCFPNLVCKWHSGLGATIHWDSVLSFRLVPKKKLVINIKYYLLFICDLRNLVFVCFNFLQRYVEDMQTILKDKSWNVRTTVCWGQRDRWLSYEGVEDFCKDSNHKLIEVPKVNTLDSFSHICLKPVLVTSKFLFSTSQKVSFFSCLPSVRLLYLRTSTVSWKTHDNFHTVSLMFLFAREPPELWKMDNAQAHVPCVEIQLFVRRMVGKKYKALPY